MDPETMAFLQMLLGGGGGGAGDPSLDPQMSMMLQGLISPNVNKKGELDMFGADLEKANLNQYQDIYGSFGSPMNTLLSGVGATGPAPLGGGVVGGGGLNPITTESILDTPNTMRFQQLAQRAAEGGQVTPETYIANMLVNQQSDPSVIVADLQAKMQDPSLDTTTKNLFSSWLPRIEKKDLQGNPSGEFVTDWNAAAQKIEKMAEPYLMEQTTLSGQNIGQNSYGQFVQYSEQPSEMMQYLQKLGLPDPRAQYGLDFSVQNDPQLSELMTSVGAKGQAFDEAKKAYEGYLKGRPVAQMLARKADEMKAGRESEYRDEMGAYVRDVAKRAVEAPPSPEAPAPTEPLLTSQEEGPPGWLKNLPGNIGDAVMGLPEHFTGMASSMHPRPPMGRHEVGRDISPLKPLTMPTMRGQGLMEQMYSRMNASPQRQYSLAGEMNRASQDQGRDMLAMVRAIAPGYNAARAGRSPFKDAIMQRLQPILAAGGARG